MSTMQMYVIAPSPLVKISLPEWEKSLSANPELIYDTKAQFSFLVDSGSRVFRIPFNTPMAIIYADPKYVADKSEVANDKVAACRQAPKDSENVIHVRDARDVESTFNYLTGRGGGTAARQTDAYGIVPFDPGNDIVRNFEEMGLLDDLASDDPKKAEAARAKLIQSRLREGERKKEAYKRLVESSEERIKRHLRANHNNLMAQWRRNEESKLGKYPPSLAEMLGFKVLDPEIKEKDARIAETARIGNEMMQRQVVLGG